MSQQQLKLSSKNSQQSTTVASGSAAMSSQNNNANNPGGEQYQREQISKSNQDQSKSSNTQPQHKKQLNRRDLNLIPPSAAIVQSAVDPYSTSSIIQGSSDSHGGYQLTINSTQNRQNKTSGWDQSSLLLQQQSRVTTVKHEKGLPNGTIMQCLKQFQRSKQQRQGHHQPPQPQAAEGGNTTSTGKPGISLSSVTPISSQNVANMPISSKSNKSQKSTKTRTLISNNASMAAEAHAQRRQNFTCTTTTKGSLRLTKKSPSNGRGATDAHQNTANHQLMNQAGRSQQVRERSSNAANAKHHHGHVSVKNTRGSNSQQHHNSAMQNDGQGQKIPSNRQQLQKTLKKGAIPSSTAQPKPEKNAAVLNDLVDYDSNFAKLMRIREERSNESKPELIKDSQKMILMTQSTNPYDPVKLISPNTCTNRQSSQEAKLLTLKNFMPAKQINSNEVTPKYLKCKIGHNEKDSNPQQQKQHVRDDSNEMRNPKIQSKSQISTHKISRTKDQQIVYGTAGCSPDNKRGAAGHHGGHAVQQHTTKSLSNNSRQKYSTQNVPQSQPSQTGQTANNLQSAAIHQQKSIKPSSAHNKNGGQVINLKQKTATGGKQPLAPQMRYSVPPDTKQANVVISSNLKSQQHQQSQAQQQQQQVIQQSSNSALNGSSELQKRFTRGGDVGGHNEASVSSGKANKSFQFGHNTALMSCSSGGDSSNPPQPVRRRSSSGKNGGNTGVAASNNAVTKQIKISQIQNVNPVIIQPQTSTSAGMHNHNSQNHDGDGDNSSSVNLRKQVPQSTTNHTTTKSGKRFTFTLNSREHQQKASRPNKHSSTISNNVNTAHHQQQLHQNNHQGQQPHYGSNQGGGSQQVKQIGSSSQQQQVIGGAKSASKTKSVSAKKGKMQGVVQNATGTQQQQSSTTPQVQPHSNNPAASSNSNKLNAISKQSKNSAAIKVPAGSNASDAAALQQQQTTVKGDRDRLQKVSLDSTPNDSTILQQTSSGNPPTNIQNKNSEEKKQQSANNNLPLRFAAAGYRNHHQKTLSGDYNLQQQNQQQPQSSFNQQKDSVLDDSLTGATGTGTGNPKHSGDLQILLDQQQSSEYQRLSNELQQRDNLIKQLYEALGRKDEQLNALTKNCEHLSSSLKMRDEKRDRSQQAIKETLKNLEEKLLMFTAQSQHNQGGLREINQSPLCIGSGDNQMRKGGVVVAGGGTPQIIVSSGGNQAAVGARVIKPDANQTPNLSKNNRMEPFMQYTQQQQRPTSSTLLSVPNSKQLSSKNNQVQQDRRPSQISEIDSLVTVAEYMGTQYGEGSKYDMSSAKKQQQDQQFLGCEGTIGSLASEIQLINNKKHANGEALSGENVNFPLFKNIANGVNSDDGDVDDMGELTSLSEMEMSNVHDASLDQLERDLMISQYKLQEQSQKAQAFAKTQQNNFMDLKANMQAAIVVAANDKHVIFETNEEAEDDVAQQLAPTTSNHKKNFIMQHNSQPQAKQHAATVNTKHLNLQKLAQNTGNTAANTAPTTQVAGQKHYRGQPQQVADEDENQQLLFRSNNSIVNKSGGHLQSSTKPQNMMSKTMSKNKMKLKLAAEILGLKKDQFLQSAASGGETQQPNSLLALAQRAEEEKQHHTAKNNVGAVESTGTNKDHSREINNKAAKKKIQLPLKIQKAGGSDSNRLVLHHNGPHGGNKSQERATAATAAGMMGTTNSNNSANGSGSNQVFNSVAIRNLKKSADVEQQPQRQSSTRVSIQTQLSSQQQNLYQNQNQSNLLHPAKSPQSRQGGVQVQGQGNMLSNRLKGGEAHTNTQKIEKLTANQLLLVQKLQQQQQHHGHKNGGAGAPLLPSEDNAQLQQQYARTTAEAVGTSSAAVATTSTTATQRRDQQRIQQHQQQR